MKHGHRRKVAEGCYKGMHYDYSSDVPQGIRMLRDEEDKDMITMRKEEEEDDDDDDDNDDESQ